MSKVVAYSLFGLLIGLVASVYLVQVIGVKVKKSMSKIIQYSNEPIGDLKLIPDFLPSPEELALKQQNTKVTISLSSESVAYFKDTAKKHHMQYQKIIRQLLDEYVAHQKSANK
ncbi:RelB/StbD replicon stabilization protein (antitoxin to RelE/StbE) [hydrothermal vent metagenome]|uniref:RelB/StbD replicon stabilization protein (Antitoxin to RelE/StbE) n=1 Tax=hydrothermal vent metagenome TaxID=652676 RepID=A0A3B1BZF0_9ZZZZ